MKKTYKDFKKIYLGASDIATLIMVGCPTPKTKNEGLVLKELHFGGDNSYKAYFVDDDIEMPKHYEKVQEFSSWLKIYDDEELTFVVRGEKIEVFRCGDYGCIIKVSDKIEK